MRIQQSLQPFKPPVIDVRDLTLALKGHWYGRYGTAFCPAHVNTRTPALSLAQGLGGRLLMHCHAGCAFIDVIDALKGRGLIAGQSNYRPPNNEKMVKSRAQQKAAAAKRADQAESLWAAAKSITGTLAERYLRSRGINCLLPETLRFQPECWHQSGCYLPAMLARIDGVKHFAVHRTYLSQRNGKADVTPAKAMLGSVKGGAVRLSDGAGPIVVAEGIETSLSLMCGLLNGPIGVWTCLSSGGMKALQLPPEPHELIVAGDGDVPGREAAHALAQRATAKGWRVSLMPAPDGADWNDILRKKAET